jgi:hypothetical protein
MTATRFLSLSVLAGCALAGAASATAGPHAPAFPVSVAQAEARAEARFVELDANRDGELSPAELNAAPLWHRAATLPGPRQPRWAGAADAELFARLDENDDGALSPDEFGRRELRDAGRALARERLFQRLDADASGGLDRAELPDVAGRLRALDADGDGLVTREEARAGRSHHRAGG